MQLLNLFKNDLEYIPSLGFRLYTNRAPTSLLVYRIKVGQSLDMNPFLHLVLTQFFQMLFWTLSFFYYFTIYFRERS